MWDPTDLSLIDTLPLSLSGMVTIAAIAVQRS